MMSSPSFTALVEVTPEAVQQLKSTLNDKPDHGIRVGVVGGGCAGLQYDLQPCEAALEGDFIQQEEGGLVLFIHPVAAAYLKGTRIHYSNDLNDSGFKFINPNASSTCGCGTSFGM
jgi:iron-sulfur cluster assembly accessory protein